MKPICIQLSSKEQFIFNHVVNNYRLFKKFHIFFTYKSSFCKVFDRWFDRWLDQNRFDFSNSLYLLISRFTY